jgi:hypothetical protein
MMMLGDSDLRAIDAAVRDELTKAFIKSGYDLQFLIRTIALTRAYQSSQ